MIRGYKKEDKPGIIQIWNDCIEAGEVLYTRMDEASFERKFESGPGAEGGILLVAEEAGETAGFIHGVAPGTFPGAKPGWAYLTAEMVAPEFRGRGVASVLLTALEEEMRGRSASTLAITSLNPVNLSWTIPGTPGHDHNNMPGLDEDCQGADFFRKHFEAAYREVAMYRAISGPLPLPDPVRAKRDRLSEQGIETGRYSPAHPLSFDALCDHVNSEYWRHVLETETEAHRTGQPNTDASLWPDGRRPSGPRPLLVAAEGNRMVGFTGPVDRQASGRGWFTGICTDPAYERRGIATVLFHLLLEAFSEEGATFTTLFTGQDNPARQIYLGAGMKPVRQFTLMRKEL